MEFLFTIFLDCSVIIGELPCRVLIVWEVNHSLYLGQGFRFAPQARTDCEHQWFYWAPATPAAAPGANGLRTETFAPFAVALSLAMVGHVMNIGCFGSTTCD